jgi:hypothetical protein
MKLKCNKNKLLLNYITVIEKNLKNSSWKINWFYYPNRIKFELHNKNDSYNYKIMYCVYKIRHRRIIYIKKKNIL